MGAQSLSGLVSRFLADGACRIGFRGHRCEKSLSLAGQLRASVYRKRNGKRKGPLSLLLQYPWFHPFRTVWKQKTQFKDIAHHILQITHCFHARTVIVLCYANKMFKSFFCEFFLSSSSFTGYSTMSFLCTLLFHFHKKYTEAEWMSGPPKPQR